MSKKIKITFIILSILYFKFIVYNYNFINNGKVLLINSILFLLIFSSLYLNKFKFFKFILNILIIVLVFFNFLIASNLLTFKGKVKYNNFINRNYMKALRWVENNKVYVKLYFLYDDNVKKDFVINQIDHENKLDIYVSKGPNYNNKIIVEDFTNKDLFYVLKFIKNNNLNNITFKFTESDIAKNNLISQSVVGLMKINDKIIFNFSVGKSFSDIYYFKELCNVDKFESIALLGSNGINTKIIYKNSNIIPENKVIKSDKNIGAKLSKGDEVILYVSKGREKKAPDLTKMNLREISEFINYYELDANILFKYDDKIDFNKVISSSIKKNDIINNDNKFELILSKGPLRMEEFKNEDEFITFAKNNNIKYEIIYENNENYNNGDIIKSNLNSNEIIKSNFIIKIYVCKNKITVPNFYLKSKDEANKLCVNLKCKFLSINDNSKKNNVIVNQSIKSGNLVENETLINLYYNEIKKEEKNIFDSDKNATKDSTLFDLFKFSN